jgi:UDP-galactopyranose mutase
MVSKVGRDLYEKFFRNYTRKQWGLDPSELDASVTARVPTRSNRDDRYFTDTYQAMPLHGYTRMFERMLDHPNIKVMLNTDYREIASDIPWRRWSTPGRSMRSSTTATASCPTGRCVQARDPRLARQFQAAGRSTTPTSTPTPASPSSSTSPGRSTPDQHRLRVPLRRGRPVLPGAAAENAALYRLYQAATEALPHVSFVGRLATYKYYNMDQVVAQALAKH